LRRGFTLWQGERVVVVEDVHRPIDPGDAALATGWGLAWSLPAHGKLVIRGPRRVRSTERIHSGFKTQAAGMPSSEDSRTSHGKPRI